MASEYERAQEESQQLFDLGIPLERAQKTAVVPIPGLLNAEEVEAVRKLASEIEHLPPAHHSHTVKFLHGERRFQRCLPRIFDKLLEAVTNNALHTFCVCEANDAPPRVRVIEYHEYSQGGNLKEPEHYDEGSLITIDVRLSHPGDFEGGEFRTLECNGEMRSWPLAEVGDALLFLSHKYHSVSPVQSGKRNVLIMETWLGQECTRSHRCAQPFSCGKCALAAEEDGDYVDLLNLDDL